MTDYLTALTDEAREFAASMAALPWQLQVGIAVTFVIIVALAKWSEPFDPYTDRPGYEPERLDSWPTCDAHDGPRRCGRALGHDGEHVDPFTGTRYHSARWSL